MGYFPLFVDLAGKEILVVGGGRIAARRIKALRETGCRIAVVSPALSGELEELVKKTPETIRWIPGTYEAAKPLDRPGGFRPFFVLAAADRAVNEAVVQDCRERNLPVNDASRKENCDFYFPGTARCGEAVAGVISGGGDHRLAARLSKAVGEAVEAVMEKELSDLTPQEQGQL